MQCAFCATGIDGVARNLESGEILEQLLAIRNLLPETERLGNIVVMGMGEPLLNLDAVLASLEIASHKDGLGIGVRRITISTVGTSGRHFAHGRVGRAVSSRRFLARTERRIAQSDRAGESRDGRRKRFSTRRTRISRRRGRRITYEYVLLADVNDRPEQAREVGAIIASSLCAGEFDTVQSGDGIALPYAQPESDGGVCRDPNAGRFGGCVALSEGG